MEFRTARSRFLLKLRSSESAREDARKLISFCTLNDIVQHKYGAMVAAFKDKHILKFRFLMVQYLVDFEGHGLTRPHV
jgi:hypothetical protein